MDLTLCLTHACNLRCDYCYAGAKFSRRMSWQTAKAAIDFAFEQTRVAAMGREAVCQLGFFGGEPLLEWEMLQRCTGYAEDQAARQGIRLKRTVTTNLMLLDASKVGWLRDHRFHVGLSIDGNAQMHDRLRRTSNGGPSHAQCAKALEFFRGLAANGEVIMVVDPRHIDGLTNSVDWLMSIGIRRISLNPNFTGGWSGDAMAQWVRVYQEIGERYVAAYRSGDPMHLNVIDGKIISRINGGYRPCDRCGFGESEIAVSAAGNFYPCERLVGDDTQQDLRMGNVQTGVEVAVRQRMLAMRGNVVEECRDCAVKDRCVNWCGCVNYASTGFINRVPAVVCHHEKLSIQVADHAASTLFGEGNQGFMQRFYGYLVDLAEDASGHDG